METLKPLIEQLVEMIKSGRDVVSGNLPDVMTQIIAYSTWGDKFTMKICVVFILLGIAMCVADYFDTERYRMHGLLVCGGVLVLIATICMAVSYADLKKMQLAPKVYMIDVLHGYLKHGE